MAGSFELAPEPTHMKNIVFLTFTSLFVLARPGLPQGALKLSGWYVGGGQQSSFNPNSSSWSFSTSYEYYRFFPDGKVFWGWTPPKNKTMDAFDRQADINSVGNYGAYIIQNGHIIMKWGRTARAPENWPFTRAADYITMAGTTYYRIQPCDGSKLSGTWGVSSFTATGQGNAVQGSTTFVFTPDGHFQRKRFTGSVNRGSSVAGMTSNSAAAAGMYEISGNTLTLTFSDGTREEHSFYRFPHEETKLLVVDGAFLMSR